MFTLFTFRLEHLVETSAKQIKVGILETISFVRREAPILSLIHCMLVGPMNQICMVWLHVIELSLNITHPP